MFTMIAAIGRSNELGKGNGLLWHLPSDMKFFRETTKGHTIVMGHKTFDSLGGMLPNRHHVVITHVSKDEFPEEVEVFHSFADFMLKYEKSEEEIFIIGGAQIYHLFKSYCDRMYLTHINAIHFNADTFFPTVNYDEWDATELQAFHEEGVDAKIVKYDRK